MEEGSQRRLLHLYRVLRTVDSETFVINRKLCKAQQPLSRLEKIITAQQAAASIADGSTVTVAGFVGTSLPEALLISLREQFEATGHPAKLDLILNAAVGNAKGRGLDVIAAEGLLAGLTYSWVGLSPAMLKLLRDNKIAGWNLPLGMVSHMIRDVAARRPGPVTHIGLGTFVDPRQKGGKVNACTKGDKVELVQLGGQRLLWYKAPAKVDVALLRGTTADLDGNVSFEREALFLDQLNQAMAAHNSGGKVIVQVERIVERGSIPNRAVHLPGAIVDKVVVAVPELHWQTLHSPVSDGSLSGEVSAPISAVAALPPNERKVIAHRGMLEIYKPHAVVNLGVGMPEGVAVLATTHAKQNPVAGLVHFSTEAGVIGGVPNGGLRFGTAINPIATLPMASMIDFYHGCGIDMACLGMAEVDEVGNVNVSNFGNGRAPGCGGFIDISQSAKEVLFMGTLTSGGLKVRINKGKLLIQEEGRVKKFRKKVFEVTFAASSARGRPILYVTERAVFKLREGEGVELVEIAPGIDIERDVVNLMGFRPIIRDVKLMDARIFQP